ncbi:hypothetical protein TNCT_327891 [Trichonephila clavata]|uniref:Uncharacterized protein n=1 Tax=Trichonephila clavata TaxID=2740835 RepID=A0A8X6LR47_TRICU|nr:hypothetical protein TNCT_327891 [Trichonephila clavata]
MEGQMNGLDFTVIMSCMRDDMQVKGKKITENYRTSALGEIQKGTICVDMKPPIRAIAGINGFRAMARRAVGQRSFFLTFKVKSNLTSRTITYSGFM